MVTRAFAIKVIAFMFCVKSTITNWKGIKCSYHRSPFHETKGTSTLLMFTSLRNDVDESKVTHMLFIARKLLPIMCLLLWERKLIFSELAQRKKRRKSIQRYVKNSAPWHLLYIDYKKKATKQNILKKKLSTIVKLSEMPFLNSFKTRCGR